uniref:Putative salivary lipocalin lipocalin n=1 Tax=Amblyomma tuberculatum TaxID=48802 RepID=A0A6M2E998_9ACAR
MAFTVIAILLFISFHGCNAYKKHCDAKMIARRLGYNPDAWKLIAPEHPRYRLMFHSSGKLEMKYKCLCTTTSSPYHGDKWKRTIKYHTSPNETTTLHGTQIVSSKKSADFYLYDNILETPYYTMIHTTTSFYFNQTMSENEVIYANKHRCILMKSKELECSNTTASDPEKSGCQMQPQETECRLRRRNCEFGEEQEWS